MLQLSLDSVRSGRRTSGQGREIIGNRSQATSTMTCDCTVVIRHITVSLVVGRRWGMGIGDVHGRLFLPTRFAAGNHEPRSLRGSRTEEALCLLDFLHRMCPNNVDSIIPLMFSILGSDLGPEGIAGSS